MKIDGREIGSGHLPYIVAEMSANHNGDLNRALKIIDAADGASADAVKIQVYHPGKLAAARGGADKVIEFGLWAGRKLGDIYHEGHTPMEWLPVLFKHAATRKITLFASVFDAEDLPILEAFGCPAYKISSFELTNTTLISAVAATGKPLIMSCGMSSANDISAAIKASSGVESALLHCVSNYPTPIERANLARIPLMHYTYGKAIGYSDHTLGNAAPIAAVALGACIIEKHLKLTPDEYGLDAAFSCDPVQFGYLVTSCCNAWKACQEDSAPFEPYRSLRSVA